MRTDYEIAERLADKASRLAADASSPSGHAELAEYVDRLREYATARREGKRVSALWQDRYLGHRIVA